MPAEGGIHPISSVGEADLRLGTRDADGADEQPHLVLLPGEHVLDAGASLVNYLNDHRIKGGNT